MWIYIVMIYNRHIHFFSIYHFSLLRVDGTTLNINSLYEIYFNFNIYLQHIQIPDSYLHYIPIYNTSKNFNNPLILNISTPNM